MPELPEPPERPAPETNWDDFVDAYGRVVLEWFRHAGLPPDDVYDLARKIMARLHDEFHTVDAASERRFRAWLHVAADQAWGRLAAGVTPSGANGKGLKGKLLLAREAREAFLQALDAECSHLRRRQILDRVRSRYDATIWEAFARTVLFGRSVESVAAEMGCDEFAVRAAIYRVHRNLLQDVRTMEEMF
jgi:hypothetical protein